VALVGIREERVCAVEYDVSFGRIGKASRAAPGPAFRLAIMGDFSGRANAGILETGERLAARKPHKVDVDNIDALIERLGISVSVPIDEDGRVLSAPIKSMDDFHPDQLVENLPVFEALLQLRRNLQSRAGFDRAAKEVLSWSDEAVLPPITARRARGSAVATDRRLSDFARLTGRPPSAEAEADDLIRRLVGPFIVPERDSRQDAMVARVDAALSDAMRRVLHHPDFQSAEALWRGMDFLVRRVETDAKLQIVLYDISAEELAADLATSEALETSALYALLVEQPAMDAHQGPLAMIAGLYQFEATPPHADLLGRIAHVSGAAGAPFVAGIGPGSLQTPMHDWHPLTRQAWTALQELPASAYLGLATPRFLLRMPYGKKTDPIDSFAFEEFTRQGGLSGMLWGHPALLVANLVAQTWKRNGNAMQLGSIATVGDLPVYIYHDTDGEQIALPCTERLFSERQAVQVASTGVNPVVSLRGRPEVRLGGFKALAGSVLAGRWAPLDLKPDPAPAAPPAKPELAAPAEPAQTATPAAVPALVTDEADSSELDALLNDLNASDERASVGAVAAMPDAPDDSVSETDPASVDATTAVDAAPPADDLDALLASLNAEPAPSTEDATEPDLDALLASLK
jgi:type VI secretion system ImpB/VipA family protein